MIQSASQIALNRNVMSSSSSTSPVPDLVAKPRKKGSSIMTLQLKEVFLLTLA